MENDGDPFERRVRKERMWSTWEGCDCEDDERWHSERVWDCECVVQREETNGNSLRTKKGSVRKLPVSVISETLNSL